MTTALAIEPGTAAATAVAAPTAAAGRLRLLLESTGEGIFGIDLALWLPKAIGW